MTQEIKPGDVYTYVGAREPVKVRVVREWTWKGKPMWQCITICGSDGFLAHPEHLVQK